MVIENDNEDASPRGSEESRLVTDNVPRSFFTQFNSLTTVKLVTGVVMVTPGGVMTGVDQTAVEPCGQASFGTAGKFDTNSAALHRLPYGMLFSVWVSPSCRLKVVLRFDGEPQVRLIGKTSACISAAEAWVLFLTFFSTMTSPNFLATVTQS